MSSGSPAPVRKFGAARPDALKRHYWQTADGRLHFTVPALSEEEFRRWVNPSGKSISREEWMRDV